jgi:hypothetical protein
VISKASSLFAARAVRISLLALATALVIVPTVARARQHVDRKDTTRLSIKHSWLGVAPPTKASSAPTPVALGPAPVVRIERSAVVSPVQIVQDATIPTFDDTITDPLRGPPSRVS